MKHFKNLNYLRAKGLKHDRNFTMRAADHSQNITCPVCAKINKRVYDGRHAAKRIKRKIFHFSMHLPLSTMMIMRLSPAIKMHLRFNNFQKLLVFWHLFIACLCFSSASLFSPCFISTFFPVVTPFGHACFYEFKDSFYVFVDELRFIS
jgi:hypothetical protein